MKKYRPYYSLPFLVAFASCADNTAAGPRSTCKTDNDCNGGLCDAQQGICVPAAGGAPALEVWPPAQNNQGWVVEEFPSPKIDGTGELVLPLQPGVTVQGSVYASSSSASGSRVLVPARIVAYRESLLPGRPKVQFETAQVAGKQDAAQSFVLWVSRGHSYTFYVAPKEPNDKLYPPLVKTGVEVDDHTALDFVLEGEDRAATVRGHVYIYPTQQLPAGLKVRVRAYRPGGLEQSTVAETAADGSFTFKVPAGLQSYTVRVETAPAADGQPLRPVPTMECTGRVLGMVEADSHVQDLGNLMLPSFTPPDKPFTVVVKSQKDSEPVPNATVTFTTPVIMSQSQNIGYDACSATYSQSGITDADGRVDLLLLAAEGKQNRHYSVTVVSPASSQAASHLDKDFEVGPSPGVLKTIELDPRYSIAGRVVDAAGKPVAAAVIDAQGMGSSGDAQALPPGAASATSAKDGSFELFMDPGVYNIDVQPPDGSAVPGVCMTAKVISSDLKGLLITLPEPRALRGSVVAAPSGDAVVPVANAQVNVYEQVPDQGWPVVTFRADLRARSITDAAGGFYLVLPSSALPVR